MQETKNGQNLAAAQTVTDLNISAEEYFALDPDSRTAHLAAMSPLARDLLKIYGEKMDTLGQSAKTAADELEDVKEERDKLAGQIADYEATERVRNLMNEYHLPERCSAALAEFGHDEAQCRRLAETLAAAIIPPYPEKVYTDQAHDLTFNGFALDPLNRKPRNYDMFSNDGAQAAPTKITEEILLSK